MGGSGLPHPAPRHDRDEGSDGRSALRVRAEVESNTVEVYVSRLRKKLGYEFVTTVRGIGYRSALG